MIEEIIAEVRQLAEQYPENIYLGVQRGTMPSGGPLLYCSYFDGLNTEYPDCGCIFGKSLRKRFKVKDGEDIAFQLENFNISCTIKQKFWCVLVQKMQDAQTPWKKAILEADKQCPL